MEKRFDVKIGQKLKKDKESYGVYKFYFWSGSRYWKFRAKSCFKQSTRLAERSISATMKFELKN